MPDGRNCGVRQCKQKFFGFDMTLRLYSNYLNSAGERVRIALAMKRIGYEYISVGQIGWEAYEKINPQRLMPTLLVEDQIIPQSTAILEYLEETFPEPRLLPANAITRAQARGFAQHITSEMHAIDVIRVRRFLENQLRVDQEGIARWQHHWFATGFTALEEILARRSRPFAYCYSDTPGWAELHLVPQVRKGLSRFNLNLAAYPLIADVYKNCIDLPAFIASAPQSQPDYPGTVIEPKI
ncbi:MAG: maleylacetoacetate isomerase [Rhizobiaceae bacterium]